MKYRAILIDPEKQSFTEVQVGRGCEEIYKALGCSEFTTGSRPLLGSLSEGFDSVYVSDDPLEDREDPRFWFQVDAERDPPSSYPLAGLGLVQGVGKMGETCDARISIDDLSKRITFTQRKFRGFDVQPGRGETTLHGIKVNELLSVTMKAPIIDGTNEE
jgi:hypothetical protein